MYKFLSFFMLISVNFGFSQNMSDTDGDGVYDNVDLDDDNDGIRDVDEDKGKVVQIDDWKKNGGVNFYKGDVVFSRGKSSWNNSISSNNISFYGLTSDYELSFKKNRTGLTNKISSVVGFGLNDENSSRLDVNYYFGFLRNTFSIYVDGIVKSFLIRYNSGDVFAIRYLSSGDLLFLQNNTVVYKTNIGKDKDLHIDTSFYGGRGTRYNTELFDFELVEFLYNDYDGDGIVNSKDSDSDNDGCFDVLENDFLDDDFDGVYGLGKPKVNSQGLILSASYLLPNHSKYLDEKIENCIKNKKLILDVSGMNSSKFKVIYNGETQDELESGIADGKYYVTYKDVKSGVQDLIIDVYPSLGYDNLKLKVSGKTNEYKIHVLQDGLWKEFSKSYYRVDNDMIFLFNRARGENISLIETNLVDGVFYDSQNTLKISFSKLLDNNPNVSIVRLDNSLTYDLESINGVFIWDASKFSAKSGVYKIKSSVDGRKNGLQFIIKK